MNTPTHRALAQITRVALSTLVAPLALAAAGCGRPAGPVPDIPTENIGRCIYTNSFSRREECLEYRGTGWTQQSATRDCGGRGSTIAVGESCNYPSILGHCLLNGRSSEPQYIAFPGSDTSLCGSMQRGCEFFGGGYFIADGVCPSTSSDGGDAGDASRGIPIYQPAELVCRPPRAGEPMGHGAGGSVCTWSAIAGCTEEGRRFADYASCEQVRTQRPYSAKPPAPSRRTGPDPRLNDPTYAAELAWVRSQIESCACVCCHSSELAPEGASNWYVEAPGNFMDTFYSAGLALGAGWINSDTLGAYPAAQNNGFSRDVSGIPSTDGARMARFFQQELASRGVTREAFTNAVPFGGPIYDQTQYRPTACTEGVGVNVDNKVEWTGGPARYVYVLEGGSANPGVPPNFDTPTGTLWRIDVPPTGTPLRTGITYGAIPEGVAQRVPQSGSAPALVNGRQYYLYVLGDVGLPTTRCTFTYPAAR